MASRIKLLFVVIVLVLIGGGIAAYKNAVLGLPLRAGYLPPEWMIEAKLTFLADDEKVRAELSIPAAAVDEGLSPEAGSVGYNYYVEKDQGEYTAVWTSEKQSQNQALYYRINFLDRKKSGGEPIPHPGGGFPVPESPGFSGALEDGAKRVIQRA